ncbi:MAG: hypothetical protein EBU03_05480, partial [Methylophilaceae bacterium]|nr:hypothetical protein [Methylophilaceae bacterium]
MLKILLKSFAVFFLVFANLALAAPKQVTLHYQATRNGKPFANITETYQQNGDQYVLDGIDSEKSESNDPIDSNKQYPSS